MIDFDLVAADFERHRAWPDSVTEQIRVAVWRTIPAGGLLLDVGAGTGRIGRAFVRAGDRYTGVDLSFAMLSRFAGETEIGNRSGLVQADGCRLPFRSRSFSGVMLAHVLSSVSNWQDVLVEAVRVLSANGTLILGRQTRSPDSVDRRMRERLREILEKMGFEMPAAGAARKNAEAWLESAARSHEHAVAASWQIGYTPQDFLARHATGVRFVALPEDVRKRSISQLSDWAIAEFGSLDASVVEDRRFETEVFRF